MEKPKLELVEPKPAIAGTPAEAVSIAKPGAFNLDLFKTKSSPNIAGVATLLTALPHHNIAQANDWVRLHSGRGKLLVCRAVLRHRSDQRPEERPRASDHRRVGDAVSAEQSDQDSTGSRSPPSQTMCSSCATSRHRTSTTRSMRLRCRHASWPRRSGCKQPAARAKAVDDYQIDFARDPDAFPEPNWPKQSLDELIGVTFTGRMITSENDPALLRLIGAKQVI